MSNKTETNEGQELTFYVCSGCEACDQTSIFLQGWSQGRLDVQLKIATLDQHPEQFVRYGITLAPA